MIAIGVWSITAVRIKYISWVFLYSLVYQNISTNQSPVTHNCWQACARAVRTPVFITHCTLSFPLLRLCLFWCCSTVLLRPPGSLSQESDSESPVPFDIDPVRVIWPLGDIYVMFFFFFFAEILFLFELLMRIVIKNTTCKTCASPSEATRIRHKNNQM